MNIHITGIGGIGTSAIAGYWLANGNMVSGSDLAENGSTRQLQKDGARVFIGPHRASNVPSDAELLVYSPAVGPDNEERKEAEARGIPAISYPEALGKIAEPFTTVAVAGTHGKSTTTAMIALIAEAAGLDPSVIIGTKLREYGNRNYRAGKGNIMVLEADEYAGSFLRYRPDIAVVTNIDEDHLDYYKTPQKIEEAFASFAANIRENGTLVGNREDPRVLRLLRDREKRGGCAVPFSLEQEEAGSVRDALQIPGKHNAANALAAMSAARALGVDDKTIISALARYRGSWRRFETHALSYPVPYTLVSDYGHHPAEIAATMEGVRERWPDAHVLLVFQPHQRKRTRLLFDRFAHCLARVPADTLVLTDIYDVAGREEAGDAVSSRDLLAAVRERDARASLAYVPFADLRGFLSREVRERDVVVLMGAGSIGELAEELTRCQGRERIYEEGQ